MRKYVLENVKDFNLDHIFDCGQCFRFEKQCDGSYTGVAFGKVVNVAFDYNKDDKSCSSGTLIINNCDEEEFNQIWKNYLDMDRDYSEIKMKLAENDETIAKAIESGSGIRILKQDLWEAIVSFIISQNNNIPRIKGCIEKLAMLFGEKAAEYEGRIYYSLPSPEVLSRLTVEDLGEVRLGYRAKYLVETAKSVVENGLPTNMEELLALTGVGPKVANCISLFGMSDFDSFPIDVWVKRVMNQLYGIDEKDVKGMTSYAKEHFGALGGIAQQYLFYYIRTIQGIE